MYLELLISQGNLTCKVVMPKYLDDLIKNKNPIATYYLDISGLSVTERSELKNQLFSIFHLNREYFVEGPQNILIFALAYIGKKKISDQQKLLSNFRRKGDNCEVTIYKTRSFVPLGFAEERHSS